MNQIQIFMPPPANWQDFQLLIADVAKSKYVEDSVQEYGRQGQSQNGVDVYAIDVFDKRIGIQCKETKNKKLSKNTIDNEIVKAKNFTPKLDLFVIATTARTDKNLQNHVNQLNSESKLRVQLWFWDDINQYINRSHAVMSSSYKTFLDNFGKTEIQNHLSALRLAFDRPAFVDDFILERNYQDFEQALASTKSMLKTGFLYDNWSKNLIAQTIPSSMIGDQSYQTFVCKIEKLLESIYQSFLRDRKKQAKNPSQLIERAGDYNIKRRDLIGLINKKLSKFDLAKIITQY